MKVVVTVVVKPNSKSRTDDHQVTQVRTVEERGVPPRLVPVAAVGLLNEMAEMFKKQDQRSNDE